MTIPPLPEDPKPWPTLSTEEGPDLRLFRVRDDLREHPVSKERFKRLVLVTPDWVNVVAVTKDRQVLFVRQFRFGTDTVTTELPAGIVEEGEPPLEAAKRELREETGYTSERWTELGSVPVVAGAAVPATGWLAWFWNRTSTTR